MRKILLSAAIATVSLFSTNVVAQCTAPTTAVSDGVNWIQAITVIDQTTSETVLDGAADKPGRSGDDSGYRDAKATKFDINPGDEYKIKLYTQYLASGRAPYHFSIFIDLNDNNDFSDAGEEIFATDKAIAGWFGGKVITMPADLTPGNHVIRFAAATTVADAANPITACNSDYTGEIEDYSINVTGGPCTSTATSTPDYFVRYVKMVDVTTGTTLMTNVTSDDGGYGDYKAVTGLDVIAGGDYKMMLRGKTGINNTDNPTWWKVWIDIDGDGEFKDAGGEVISKQNDAWGYNNFKMPDLAPGNYTMRVATSSAEIPDACTDISQGEIEDYTLKVLDAAQPTFVNNDEAIAEKNSSKIIDVLANDVVRTNPIASVAVVTAPTNGVAVANGDNTITYTPNADYIGLDSFTYTVTDDKGLVSDEATVSINVVAFKGLVKIIEDLESGTKGVFDRDVSGSGQSMGLAQTQTVVDDKMFLNGANSLELTYKDGENATNPGDFDWYDRFGINHWAGGAPAAIPEMADHDHLYLSLGIKSTTISYGAKASFLVKTKVDGNTYYVQSETVLLGNHETNWNILQVDLKDATKWGDWMNPVDGKPILGGSNGVLGNDLWINAIIIQGVNNSPDMILNFDNLIVTTVELDLPEVNVPTEPLANNNLDLAEITAYPNPVANSLNLDLSKEVSSITIFSSVGTVIYSNETPSMDLTIDTQSWNAGMYFIRVNEGSNSQTLKIIKK